MEQVFKMFYDFVNFIFSAFSDLSESGVMGSQSWPNFQKKNAGFSNRFSNLFPTNQKSLINDIQFEIPNFWIEFVDRIFFDISDSQKLCTQKNSFKIPTEGQITWIIEFYEMIFLIFSPFPILTGRAESWKFLEIHTLIFRWMNGV